MEDLMTFLAILFIAFGVLQIILFFKLWGMTNDVKEIKRLMREDECPLEIVDDPTAMRRRMNNLFYSVKKFAYMGETAKAKSILLRAKYDLAAHNEYIASQSDAYFKQGAKINTEFIAEIDKFLESINN